MKNNHVEHAPETITRAHLAQVVQQKIGLSHTESSELVSSLIDLVLEVLQDSEELKIPSFGSFRVRDKAKRMGRNPKTKEEFVIPSRKTVSFYTSRMLKEKISAAFTK